MDNKGKTWLHGTNSRLPFGLNVTLKLSVALNWGKALCDR